MITWLVAHCKVTCIGKFESAKKLKSGKLSAASKADIQDLPFATFVQRLKARAAMCPLGDGD